MSLKGLFDFYYQKIIEESNMKGLNTLNTQIDKFFKTNNFKLKDIAVASAFDITININPFSKQTTNNYHKQRAPELKFTSDGFERFYNCTSGIPFYINTFAR